MLAAAFTLSSCDDFLERSAQNLIVPETAKEYREMLQGETYFKDIFSRTAFVNFMTDDVEYQQANSRFPELTLNSSSVDAYKDAYTWQPEIENDNFSDGAYIYLYKQVKVANLCINALPTLSGTDEEKALLEGQAKFMRAMAYFYLANLYGPAYNEAQPTDPCVPLVLTGDITTDKPQLATVQQVWQQMLQDAEDAAELLKNQSTTSYYDVNYVAALVLCTRINLFMENWDKTISYGEQALAEHPDLQDITGQTVATLRFDGDRDRDIVNFLNSGNVEIIFAFNTPPSSSLYTLFGLLRGLTSNGYWFAASSQSSYEGQRNLISLYDGDPDAQTGDRRLLYWFVAPVRRAAKYYANTYDTWGVLKYDLLDDASTYFMQCLRSAEVYLSVAEAYARRNQGDDADKAIALLNTLRAKRIAPYTPLTATDFTDNKALVDFVWDERRRELCFEECHRWWDMRREGQKAVIHRFNDGGQAGDNFRTYTLKAHDAAFVLNVPRAERSVFPDFSTSERPQRNPD